MPDGENSYAQFFEAYSAKLNISVVAIRGTDVGRISDLIEDLKVSATVLPGEERGASCFQVESPKPRS